VLLFQDSEIFQNLPALLGAGMNLRTGAIVLSLLPLALTLVLAVPENGLQQRVSDATLEVRQTSLATSAARDIEDARIDALVALRAEGHHSARARADFERAISKMRTSTLRLLAFAEEEKTSIESARRIVIAATAVADRFDAMSLQTARGNFGAVNSVLPLSYYAEISSLQEAVRAFIQRLRAAQATQVSSLGHLNDTSRLLFSIELAGLAATSALLLYFSLRTVRGILNLRAKGDRYRRGERIGEPSNERDELGLLDGAIHELVAAQELRESQLQRYRLLAEITRDIILFIDRDNLTIIDANAAALAAYGYARADLIGKPATLLRSGPPLTPEMLRQSDTPAGLSTEALQLRSDGSVFPGEAKAHTAEVDGHRTIVVTIRDTTERRQAAEQVDLALEAAVAASRIKSEFVATMSHEIRTPMHGVIAMSELLLETVLAPLQREYAGTLKESAHALLAIIDDILDFSKLEANKIELETIAFEPAQVIAGVVNITGVTARDKGVTVKSLLAADLPVMLLGDATRLRQILLNLVGNAVKFTSTGSVTVTTSVERDDGRSILVRFAISDTGIGVTAEARERLFEAFAQGDGSTTRRFGGTGLGLSISRRLVELMDGHIWLGDHEGPGSTFCFNARFERASGAAALFHGERGGVTTRPASAVPNRHARILIAEDSALIRRVARLQLQELQYDVDVVHNGAEAVVAVATGGYDLVLMDMRMPEMDGLSATRVIREAERTNGRRIVVVALTANVLEGDRQACMEAGMDDFLAKPLELSQLKAVLERWLPAAPLVA
jgi:PAS domain S-box-containing protein